MLVDVDWYLLVDDGGLIVDDDEDEDDGGGVDFKDSVAMDLEVVVELMMLVLFFDLHMKKEMEGT